MKKVSIIIPALNEEKSIAITIDKIPKGLIKKMGYDLEIIVVDGGSKDKTREIAVKKGAKVIVELRKGYGRAYITGFKYAKGDIIITGDADGTYPFEITPLLIFLIEKYGFDFVSTNRFALYEPGAWMPINFVGNKLISFLQFLLFRIRFKDSQSGMWCFRSHLLKCMNLMSQGMEFSSEIKIEAARCTKKIAEVPIKYSRRRYGSPKLNWFRDGKRILKFLLMKFLINKVIIPFRG